MHVQFLAALAAVLRIEGKNKNCCVYELSLHVKDPQEVEDESLAPFCGMPYCLVCMALAPKAAIQILN